MARRAASMAEWCGSDRETCQEAIAHSHIYSNSFSFLPHCSTAHHPCSWFLTFPAVGYDLFSFAFHPAAGLALVSLLPAPAVGYALLFLFFTHQLVYNVTSLYLQLTSSAVPDKNVL